MTDRTIIDILRKGNQELFHSSMVAWLLDPLAEHGYGSGFLDAFARVVEARGDPRFRAALSGSPMVKVATETAARKSRYDIDLAVGGTHVVIENKTKSLGDDPQFEKYRSENTVLVALGLCEMSFSERVRGKYPLVTYADVLAILDRLPDPPASDFRVLADHYRRFLRRELDILARIDNWYATGDPAQTAAVPGLVGAGGTYTENDRRFLNLYLLERLRRDLTASPRWRHCRVKTDKNMQSGVWLAIFDLEKGDGVFGYETALAALCEQQKASVWLHVELWDGILAGDADRPAGVIQVRCSAKDAAAFAVGFRQVRPPQEGEGSPARRKKHADSFYLLSRPLLRAQLTGVGLLGELERFAGGLGRFS